MTTLSITDLSKSERLRLGLSNSPDDIKAPSASAPAQWAGFGSPPPSSRESRLPRPWWWERPSTSTVGDMAARSTESAT